MSNLDLLWIIPLMLVLLAMKGFFSGSEIALVNADRPKLGHAAKQGSMGARMVLESFRRPERILTTTLVGTNLATVTLTTLGTLVMIRLFGPEAGDLWAFVIYTPLFLVLGEIVPKAVYQEKADRIAPIVVYPIRAFYWLLMPFILLFSTVARLVARWVGAPASSEGLFVTRDQLRALVEMAERAKGGLVFDRFRIERAIRFPDATVGEAMQPAAEIVAVDRQATLADAAELALRSGHMSLPVYEDSATNLVGTLSLTPWKLMEDGIGAGSVADRMQTPIYVSANSLLEELAAMLRERRQRLAIVVDEYGSAIGLITMEDVAEAVVGDVEAGDVLRPVAPRAERHCEVLDDGSFRMDARLPISEANDLLGSDLPTRDAHTVGGLITARLRHLPQSGESVVVNGYRLIVERASARRVESVLARVERSVEAEGED